MNFLYALAIIVGGLWFLRTLGRTKQADVPAVMKKYGGYALISAGALLSLRGNLNMGITAVAFGLAMVGFSTQFVKNFGWPGQAGPSQDKNHQAPPRASTGKMSKDEAYAVLGLKPGASREDVKAAHRQLMKDFHPDTGGTNYLASKINEAKDVLSA